MSTKSWSKLAEEAADFGKKNAELRARIYNINCLCVRAMEELSVPVPPQYKRMSDKLREILVLCDITYDDIPY